MTQENNKQTNKQTSKQASKQTKTQQNTKMFKYKPAEISFSLVLWKKVVWND